MIINNLYNKLIIIILLSIAKLFVKLFRSNNEEILGYKKKILYYRILFQVTN